MAFLELLVTGCVISQQKMAMVIYHSQVLDVLSTMQFIQSRVVSSALLNYHLPQAAFSSFLQSQLIRD